MKKAIFIAAALMSIVTPSLAAGKSTVPTSFEIKGARIGDSAEKIDSEFNTSCASSTNKTCMVMFLPGVEIKNDIPEQKRLFAGSVVTAYIFGLDDDKKVAFVEVRFASEGFKGAIDALQAKYGKPANKTKEVVQTRSGGSFDNLKASWESKDEGIMLKQFVGSLETSSVSLISRKAGENAIKEKEQKAREPGRI